MTAFVHAISGAVRSSVIRWLIVAGMFVVYGLLFGPLESRLGTALAVVMLVPTICAGLWFGIGAGAGTGAASVLLVTALYVSIGQDLAGKAVRIVIPGIVFMSIGGFVGLLRRYHIELRLRAAQLAQESRNLQEEIELRRAVEKQLIAEKKVFTAGPTVVYCWQDQDGLAVNYVSPNVKGVFGYTPEDFITGTRSYLDCIHPDERQQVLDTININGDARTGSFSLEYRFRREDGQYRWVNCYIVVQAPAGPEGRVYHGYVNDITESKMISQAVQQQKEILQAILDTIPIMVMFLDSQGTHNWVNGCYERLTGWSLDEIMGQEMVAHYFSDSAERARFLACMNAARGEFSEFSMAVKNGTRLETTWASVQLSNGTTIAIGEDITRRKQADEKIRGAMQTFVKVFNTCPVLMAISTADEGRFLEVNDTFVELTGYSREEIIGQTAAQLQLFADPGQREALAGMLANQGAVRNLGLRLKKRDGSMRYGLFWIERLDLSDAPCLLTLVIPLSEPASH